MPGPFTRSVFPLRAFAPRVFPGAEGATAPPPTPAPAARIQLAVVQRMVTTCLNSIDFGGTWRHFGEPLEDEEQIQTPEDRRQAFVNSIRLERMARQMGPAEPDHGVVRVTIDVVAVNDESEADMYTAAAAADTIVWAIEEKRAVLDAATGTEIVFNRPTLDARIPDQAARGIAAVSIEIPGFVKLDEVHAFEAHP